MVGLLEREMGAARRERTRRCARLLESRRQRAVPWLSRLSSAIAS
jgi:hypothetical protein